MRVTDRWAWAVGLYIVGHTLNFYLLVAVMQLLTVEVGLINFTGNSLLEVNKDISYCVLLVYICIRLLEFKATVMFFKSVVISCCDQAIFSNQEIFRSPSTLQINQPFNAFPVLIYKHRL